MDLPISSRVQRIKPSATLAVSAKTRALKAKGVDIISLGIGEPDFDTPMHIKEAAIKAIHDGFTKYTPVDGIPSLKEAIINKFFRENNLRYQSSQIIVSCGAKQSFYNLAQALLNEGDEVIIPIPYWVSYPDMILLADGKPVFIPTDIKNHFKITPEMLKAAITPKTRLVLINSPSNPSGKAYTKAELSALAEVLLPYPNIVIVTDDIYERIYWGVEPFANIVNACPELYDRTLVINGVSKTYAMTGWRIGYAAGPQKIIQAMTDIQSQSTSGPTSISQMAAVAALAGEQSCVIEMVSQFKLRHDFAYDFLKNIPGVECLPADGSFYLFPKVQTAINKLTGIHDDVTLAEHLLEAGVAVVPGSAFGSPGYLRLSTAIKIETLAIALERLKGALRF